MAASASESADRDVGAPLPGREALKVLVRVRPRNEAEASHLEAVTADEATATIRLDAKPRRAAASTPKSRARDDSRVLKCRYDAVFGPDATQPEVFSQVSSAVSHACHGVNATIFAYGQTGTGKTHTMLGEGMERLMAAGGDPYAAEPKWGVLPRAVQALFNGIDEQSIRLRPDAATNHAADAAAAAAADAAEAAAAADDDAAEAADAADAGSAKGEEDTPTVRPDDGMEEAEGKLFVSDARVSCSYLQVYNGRVFDLLADPVRARPLTLRESLVSSPDAASINGVYVSGLSEERVNSLDDVLDVLQRGTRNRAVRATDHNEASSRSHAVLRLAVTMDLHPAEQAKAIARARAAEAAAAEAGEGDEAVAAAEALAEAAAAAEAALRQPSNGTSTAVVRKAVLTLVDLAGSEKWDTRATATRMTAGRQKELTSINTSLSALGNCISALVRKRQRREVIQQADATGQRPPQLPQVHVPYRDSPLTRLLQDSLGGNCKTVVIATVGPSAQAAEETVSTLHFADRARRVLVRARVNEVVDDTQRLQRARREIQRLKRALKSFIAVYGGTFDGPFGVSNTPPVGWKPPVVVVVAKGAAVAPVLTSDPAAAASGRFRGSALPPLAMAGAAAAGENDEAAPADTKMSRTSRRKMKRSGSKRKSAKKKSSTASIAQTASVSATAMSVDSDFAADTPTAAPDSADLPSPMSSSHSMHDKPQFAGVNLADLPVDKGALPFRRTSNSQQSDRSPDHTLSADQDQRQLAQGTGARQRRQDTQQQPPLTAQSRALPPLAPRANSRQDNARPTAETVPARSAASTNDESQLQTPDPQALAITFSSTAQLRNSPPAPVGAGGAGAGGAMISSSARSSTKQNPPAAATPQTLAERRVQQDAAIDALKAPPLAATSTDAFLAEFDAAEDRFRTFMARLKAVEAGDLDPATTPSRSTGSVSALAVPSKDSAASTVTGSPKATDIASWLNQQQPPTETLHQQQHLQKAHSHFDGIVKPHGQATEPTQTGGPTAARVTGLPSNRPPSPLASPAKPNMHAASFNLGVPGSSPSDEQARALQEDHQPPASTPSQSQHTQSGIGKPSPLQADDDAKSAAAKLQQQGHIAGHLTSANISSVHTPPRSETAGPLARKTHTSPLAARLATAAKPQTAAGFTDLQGPVSTIAETTGQASFAASMSTTQQASLPARASTFAEQLRVERVEAETRAARLAALRAKYSAGAPTPSFGATIADQRAAHTQPHPTLASGASTDLVGLLNNGMYTRSEQHPAPEPRRDWRAMLSAAPYRPAPAPKAYGQQHQSGSGDKRTSLLPSSHHQAPGKLTTTYMQHREDSKRSTSPMHMPRQPYAGNLAPGTAWAASQALRNPASHYRHTSGVQSISSSLLPPSTAQSDGPSSGVAASSLARIHTSGSDVPRPTLSSSYDHSPPHRDIAPSMARSNVNAVSQLPSAQTSTSSASVQWHRHQLSVSSASPAGFAGGSSVGAAYSRSLDHGAASDAARSIAAATTAALGRGQSYGGSKIRFLAAEEAVAVDGSVVKKPQDIIDPPARHAKPPNQGPHKGSRRQQARGSRSTGAAQAVYGGGAFGRAQSRTRK